MNLEEQKISGTNQVVVNDSLEAPLLSIKVSRGASTSVPSTSDLIVYVDKSPESSPTSERKQFVFNLSQVLGYVGTTSDQFVLEVRPKNNSVAALAYVNRKISESSVLSTPTVEELDEALINLFEGTNYIYTNYSNEIIEIIYPKDDEMNRRYLNNAIYCHNKLNGAGDFSLDDIYFKDAFTKTQNKLNIEVDNAEISTLTSKNNKFSLDSNGNLVVNSITTNSGGGSQALDNTAICNLIYPVGSIYLSVNSVNPSTLFYGTWVQFGKGQTLIGVDSIDSDFSSAEMSGGEKEHTLTVSELPKNFPSFNKNIIWDAGTKETGWAAGEIKDYSSNSYKAKAASASEVFKSLGDGQSHNNLPPYITVYMWKRIS